MERQEGLPQGVPEYYSDQFQVSTGVFTVAPTFGLNTPHPTPGQPSIPRPQAIERMSPQHANLMAMILRRQLKHCERETGIIINIPFQVYSQLGVSPEDW